MSATCPSTFTLRKARSMRPPGPITKVERSMPLTFFPYMFFSLITSYFSHTTPSTSHRSGKGRPYLSLNFAWADGPSRLMPSTAVFFDSNASISSRKSQASRVQPDVFALG